MGWRTAQPLWEEPDHGSTPNIAFFGLDTNGAQSHVRKDHPGSKEKVWEYKAWLEQQLGLSTATWKILLAHHPMYTKSTQHGLIGRCLRDARYGKTLEGEDWEGYGLERVVRDGGVNVVLTGHEHLFQHQFAHGVHHFVCGASGANEINFYGGEQVDMDMTWFDKDRKHNGFGVLEVTKKTLRFSFVNTEQETIYNVDISK
jgi:hypothetical protein